MNTQTIVSQKAKSVIPHVLLAAKKIAEEQLLNKKRLDAEDGGGSPWDQGHWANRK